jgi:hypothetical protein
MTDEEKAINEVLESAAADRLVEIRWVVDDAARPACPGGADRDARDNNA